MNLFAHSISSKGGLAFARRIGTIASRFGVGPERVAGYLDQYLQTLARFGANATFPITAVVLQRHPNIIRRLAAAGVEFAVHGYVHTDHALLPADRQREQIARALDVFREEKIPVSGFRGPYLRFNADTVSVVEQLGFTYISNETFVYDVLDQDQLTAGAAAGYARAMRLYAARPALESVVRPWMKGILVEIPVAMPDDEILVDRLELRSGEAMGDAWTKALALAYDWGDLLTLQLHPERGEICREGLSILLSAARQKWPPIWLAQLRDIATWWRRRLGFSVRVDPEGASRWRVTACADPDATIWMSGLAGESTTPWYGPYTTLDGSTTVVETSVRPIIGVSSDSPDAARFLSEEGFAVETVQDPGACAVYVDRPGTLTMSEQASLLREIQRANAPLVGISRWPNRSRAALAITGDIDALTLLDFVYRVWEVR
jgi:peptidoglycan/xylan/chitin deacetylase (PgdA/CDA1 family)